MADNHFQTIIQILVRRGLASSPAQAIEMVRAGKVVILEHDDAQWPVRRRPTVVTDLKETYRFNEPVTIVGETSKPRGKRIPRREFARYMASTLALTPQDVRFLKSLRIATEGSEGQRLI